MGLFNSGEIKTKLLTLPLLWAYQSTTKCTLHHIGIGFPTISRKSNFTSQETDHKVTGTAFQTDYKASDLSLLLVLLMHPSVAFLKRCCLNKKSLKRCCL